jgi:triphosphoribosyl-dephospho-CoA synthase
MIKLTCEQRCLRASPATLATWALREELRTWPKPGLVSYKDCGSHRDMDAALFEASIAALARYFGDIFNAGRDGADLADLRALGIAAEARMLQTTHGVNTHRGAIFSLGLLVAAAGRRDADASLSSATLGTIVRKLWGPALARVESGQDGSHGVAVARRHGVSGARGEAARGFPHIYSVGLPALRGARHAGWNRAKVQCLFALIAQLDDTNLLYRGGLAGLNFARVSALVYLDAGGVERPESLQEAAALHDQFVARGLSPGGAGDLLAATILVDALDTAAASEN